MSKELRIMRKALYFYKNASIRLCDENLTEDAFTILKEELTDMADEISEDEPRGCRMKSCPFCMRIP